MNALSEEMYLSGAPVDGLGVASLVAHTLLLDGTDWQKQTIVPGILSGDVLLPRLQRARRRLRCGRLRHASRPRGR